MESTRSEMDPAAARARVTTRDWRPRNCVWELTLACNLRCTHCGSRAGHARARELTTAECLGVVDQLARMGTELVTLSGGEPTLRRDWDVIARALVDRGLRVNMVTNGAYRDAEAAMSVARRARDAGLCNVGLSVDGNREIHDAIRGPGTLAKTLVAMEAFRAVGLPVGLLTTVSRLNLHALEEVRELAMAQGAHLWRLQLAKPMGAMDTRREDILAPEDLLYLIPLLARLKAKGGIRLTVGDSIGYYGPYDDALRGQGWRGRHECWQGCQAGLQAVGIQADGGVKGCLSLQAGAHGEGPDPFVEGNLRATTLEALWHRPGAFAFNRDFTTDQLTGGCASCRHGARCRGGARCVSSAVAGVLTEDPYCYTAVAAARGLAPEAPPSHGLAAAAFMVATLAGAACETGTSSPAADVSLSPRDAGRQDATPRLDAGGTDAVVHDATPADARRPDAQVPDAQVPDAGRADAIAPDAGRVDGAVPDASRLDAAGPDALATDARVPDMNRPDAAIDCSAVCCNCEYGIIPPDVYEFCCAPCENACCECDYGEPPPPQCCP